MTRADQDALQTQCTSARRSTRGCAFHSRAAALTGEYVADVAASIFQRGRERMPQGADSANRDIISVVTREPVRARRCDARRGSHRAVVLQPLEEGCAIATRQRSTPPPRSRRGGEMGRRPKSSGRRDWPRQFQALAIHASSLLPENGRLVSARNEIFFVRDTRQYGQGFRRRVNRQLITYGSYARRLRRDLLGLLARVL